MREEPMEAARSLRCRRERYRRERHRRVFRLCAVACLLFAWAAAAFFIEWGQSGPATGISKDGTSDAGNTAGIRTGGTVEEAAPEAEWNLILVNRWTPIPASYDVELVELSNGERVDARIYPALQEMFDAMRADEVYPVVVSGYRTESEQRELWEEKISEYQSCGYSREEAERQAEQWVAVPGTSEHQLGIAVDINADGIHSVGQEVYDWLEENSCFYGFIQRYPTDKTTLTGTGSEPWHYRYVGVEAAMDMAAQNLCLEEYLEADSVSCCVTSSQTIAGNFGYTTFRKRKGANRNGGYGDGSSAISADDAGGQACFGGLLGALVRALPPDRAGL